MSESKRLGIHNRGLEKDRIIQLARLVSARLEPQEIPAALWPEIIHLAIRHGLGPFLRYKLVEQGMPIMSSTAFKELENSAKIADFNYQLLQEGQSKVQKALTEAGIPAIWIKGIALAQTIYPRPNLRPMNDLDVVVPYRRDQEALAVVRAIGYYSPSQDPLSKKIHASSGPSHHHHLRGGPSGGTILELHFRLLGDDRLLPLAEVDWFWGESEKVGKEPFIFSVLKPEAHFLYLCAHAILQHGEGEFRLQRYFDLHLLATQSQINWGLVVSQAVQLGLTYSLTRGLLLTKAYFDSPIPEFVNVQLDQQQPTEREISRAHRLQSAGHRWEGTLLSFSDLSLGERIRTLYHLAFPPPAYMRLRYAVPPGRSLLPYYFFRWSDSAKEIISAVLERFR